MMTQLHGWFTDDQVKVPLREYCQRLLARAEIHVILDIGKARVPVLFKEYRKDWEAFSVAFQRPTPGRWPAAIEVEMERELLREKEIVEDERLPISGYNYPAMQVHLKKKDIEVSVTPNIDRCERADCQKPREKRKSHDREM